MRRFSPRLRGSPPRPLGNRGAARYRISMSRKKDLCGGCAAGLAWVVCTGGACCAPPVGVMGSMKLVGEALGEPGAFCGTGGTAALGGGSSEPLRPQAPSASGRTTATTSAQATLGRPQVKFYSPIPDTDI
jgi:hypothetical protein